jgi:cation transport regulator ChaC
MLYFAYGSNMSVPRLRHRVPSAHALSAAMLHGHRLAFHKAGRDGSAKCDAAPGRCVQEHLYGVVYRIDPQERPLLDAAEGLGNGYEEKRVSVRCLDGPEVEAFTYCATHIDPSLRPFPWYLEHVIRGARAHGLPPSYIAMITGVQTTADWDASRQASEMAIYRGSPGADPHQLRRPVRHHRPRQDAHTAG